MTFQQEMKLNPSIAKEGELASLNPTAVALPPEGAYRAGENGLYQARFAWIDDTDSSFLNNTGSGMPVGFIKNAGKGVIGVDAIASMFIPKGVEIAAFTLGDFWVRTSTAATVGQKIFAVLADGTIKTGASGATIAGAIETSFVVVSEGDANTLVKMTKQGVL